MVVCQKGCLALSHSFAASDPRRDTPEGLLGLQPGYMSEGGRQPNRRCLQNTIATHVNLEYRARAPLSDRAKGLGNSQGKEIHDKLLRHPPRAMSENLAVRYVLRRFLPSTYIRMTLGACHAHRAATRARASQWTSLRENPHQAIMAKNASITSDVMKGVSEDIGGRKKEHATSEDVAMQAKEDSPADLDEFPDLSKLANFCPEWHESMRNENSTVDS